MNEETWRTGALEHDRHFLSIEEGGPINKFEKFSLEELGRAQMALSESIKWPKPLLFLAIPFIVYVVLVAGLMQTRPIAVFGWTIISASAEILQE